MTCINLCCGAAVKSKTVGKENKSRERSGARTRLKKEVYHRLLEVTPIVDVVHFVGTRLVEVTVVIQSGDTQAVLLLPTRSFYQLESRKWSTYCLLSISLNSVLKSAEIHSLFRNKVCPSTKSGSFSQKLLSTRSCRTSEGNSDLSSKFQNLLDSVCRPFSQSKYISLAFFY